jgi:hypothetical protein
MQPVLTVILGVADLVLLPAFLSMAFCKWHLAHGILQMVFCQWHFANGI